MALLPVNNFIKMCNGHLALNLSWNDDLKDEPFYAAAHASSRLEQRFGVNRNKNNSFGPKALADSQLRDLLTSTLISEGKVKSQSNAKGYVSTEERTMAATSYMSTPQPVLRTTMLEADSLVREFLAVLRSARSRSTPLAARFLHLVS